MAVSIESLCSCMHLIIDNNILQFLYDVIITQKINVGSKVYTTVKQDILLLYAWWILATRYYILCNSHTSVPWVSMDGFNVFICSRMKPMVCWRIIAMWDWSWWFFAFASASFANNSAFSADSASRAWRMYDIVCINRQMIMVVASCSLLLLFAVSLWVRYHHHSRAQWQCDEELTQLNEPSLRIRVSIQFYLSHYHYYQEYRKSGNFRCKNIFLVDGGYEN